MRRKKEHEKEFSATLCMKLWPKQSTIYELSYSRKSGEPGEKFRSHGGYVQVKDAAERLESDLQILLPALGLQVPHILQSESQETKAEEAGKVKKEEKVDTEAVCLEAWTDPMDWVRSLPPTLTVLPAGSHGKALPMRCNICRTKQQPQGKVFDLTKPKRNAIYYFTKQHLESIMHDRNREIKQEEQKARHTIDCPGLWLLDEGLSRVAPRLSIASMSAGMAKISANVAIIFTVLTSMFWLALIFQEKGWSSKTCAWYTVETGAWKITISRGLVVKMLVPNRVVETRFFQAFTPSVRTTEDFKEFLCGLANSIPLATDMCFIGQQLHGASLGLIAACFFGHGECRVEGDVLQPRRAVEAMVDMPRIWLMVPPRAPSFCPETNPGLAPATSKLFYGNFLKSRNIYEESHNELFAKRTAPRKPFVEVNTGLNTSLKRPKSDDNVLQMAAVFLDATLYPISRGQCSRSCQLVLMSGEEIAVPRDQLSTVRALKQRLHGLCGVSRFRQRLTHQGTVLVDDARLDAEVTDVELLVLPFSDTSEEQAEALCEAARDGTVGKVEELLQRPQDPNLAITDPESEDLSWGGGPGPDLLTALSEATEHGHLEIVHLLLEAGARIEGPANDALAHAARKSHIDIVRLLLQAGADKDENGEVLSAASAGGHVEMVQLWLEAGTHGEGSCNRALNRALFNAARRGHTDIVRLLLEAGADKDACEIRYGSRTTVLAAATESGHLEVVRLLLEAGASVVWVDGAFVKAARGGRIDIVQLLLEAGADKNAYDPGFPVLAGRTALAAAAEYGHLEIVRLLLEAGACVERSANEALVTARMRDYVDIVKAQMSALSRARSASSLDQGTKDDSWPVPVDPETGRPVRPEPPGGPLEFKPTAERKSVIDDVYSNPERKACPEMYMAQRYGVHAAHPVGFPGRYTPSACRVDSTGDLSVYRCTLNSQLRFSMPLNYSKFDHVVDSDDEKPDPKARALEERQKMFQEMQKQLEETRASEQEKGDCSELARELLKTCLQKAASVKVANGVLSVAVVEKVEGEASTFKVRGQLRHTWDLNFKVKWTYQWMGANFDEGPLRAEGAVAVIDFGDATTLAGPETPPTVRKKWTDKGTLDLARQKEVERALGGKPWPPVEGTLLASLVLAMQAFVKQLPEQTVGALRQRRELREESAKMDAQEFEEGGGVRIEEAVLTYRFWSYVKSSAKSVAVLILVHAVTPS
ncbi:Ankyrin repeat and KH domain-containing protein mask [Symbiodinium microadriaticum]|uniref:Ankyrin repeat and KH domain-containing protein mask n=1 Tax=Symbiodinium microadriaticum TaxID=2951 RepID=A0A1Q9C932_SYMMI|nr:Ankyrin repeat and KH domain-containing protein mask [Symbiodinium microadriaticum]